MPQPEYVDRRTILARHRDKLVLHRSAGATVREEQGVWEAIDRSVAELNGDLDALDDFLNQQNYRLAYWKTADQQLGYRRFFDVNTLIGLRVEREYVFEETHALVLDWLKRGVLDGVRVDHPDGLRDPLEYFHRLRERAPDAWMVAEKILEPGEFLRRAGQSRGRRVRLPERCCGGAGRAGGNGELTSIYGEFTGQPTDFRSIAQRRDQRDSGGLGSDVNRLTSLFVEICEANRDRADYTQAR